MRLTFLLACCITASIPLVAEEEASIEISRAVTKGQLVSVTVWQQGKPVSHKNLEVANDSPSFSFLVPAREHSIVVAEGTDFIALTPSLHETSEAVTAAVYDTASFTLAPEVSVGRIPDHLVLELSPCTRGSGTTTPLVLPLTVDRERLRVDASVPAGCFEISLDAPGYAQVNLGRRQIERAQLTDLGAITLTPGARVEIRVIDHDAAPLEGVEVIARNAVDLVPRRSPDQRSTPRALARGTTNNEGWVVLRDVSPGRIRFELQAKQRRLAVRSDFYDIDPGRDLVIDPLELPAPGSAVVNTKLPDNVDELIEIFGVRLRTTESSPASWQTTTEPVGSDGAAQFAELPPGKWIASISGRIRDGMAFEIGETELEVRSGSETLASVPFDVAVVKGRLEKGDSLYEKNGTLSFRSKEEGMRPTARLHQGEFVVLLKSGVQYTTRLQLPFAQPILLASVVEAPTNGELVIELPDGSIEGTVRNEDGTPVSNAVVAATGEVEKGMTTNPAVVVNADETGDFVLDLVAPGPWTLRATAGREKAEPQSVEMHDGERITGIELVIGSGNVIRGRVTGSFQQVPMTRVMVTFLNGSSSNQALRPVFAGRDGSFEIPIEAGDRGTIANLMVVAADRTAFSSRMPLENGMTVVIPERAGSVLVRRSEGTWGSDKRLPVFVAADGSSISALVAGSADASDLSLLYVPRLAASIWRLVEPRTSQELAAVRQGRADQLRTIATFEVIDGRTIEVSVDP